MAMRRGMLWPSSGERSYPVSPRLDRSDGAWFPRDTVKIAALGLKRKQWEPYAFASPSMVLIAFVIVFPLAYSFYLSFQNFDLSVGPDYEFVGMKNYTEGIFRDPRFLGSVWNTAVIIAPSLVLELLLGLGIAMLLSRVLHGRPIITALLAIPAMVSPVMAAMAWRMMFGVKYGAINNLGRPARSPRRLFRLVLVAPHLHRGRRLGRGLAQHAVHDAGAAGRTAVDSPGAVRGGQSRRRQPLATLLVRHAAVAQVHHGGGGDDPAHRPHQAVRADLRADIRGPGREHRDRRLHDLPGGLQGLPDELRRGALLRHRRRRADPDAVVLLDAAHPRGEGGLMAIALERSAVVPQRARRHRIWRGLGHAPTYLGLATALVFFLGPFFWILTTSLKGNEDFFAFPPVWIPAEPSLKHYVGLFTRSSGARYFTNSMVISTLSMIASLAVSLPTAYSIARWRFGGGLLSIVLLVLRM